MNPIPISRIFQYSVFSVLFLSFLSCQPKTSKEAHANKLSLPEKVDFNFHIKPILSDRCFKCHGPDEKVREANLRLDTEEGAFALLDSAKNHYAIVPGKFGKKPASSANFQYRPR